MIKIITSSWSSRTHLIIDAILYIQGIYDQHFCRIRSIIVGSAFPLKYRISNIFCVCICRSYILLSILYVTALIKLIFYVLYLQTLYTNYKCLSRQNSNLKLDTLTIHFILLKLFCNSYSRQFCHSFWTKINTKIEIKSWTQFFLRKSLIF